MAADPKCTNCRKTNTRCLFEYEKAFLKQWISHALASNDNNNICILRQLKAALHSGKRLKEHVNFLIENVNILRQEAPHDILLKSGRDNNGSPSIPTQRAILGSKSPILKDILDSCKAPSTPPNETLTFSELNHDELKMLLDFIYKGSFENADADAEKFMNHVPSLLVAAHKYNISSLEDYCEAIMVANLNDSNVVRFLEISEISGATKLKDAAMDYIKKNDDVIFRSEFVDFATKYPLLSLDITRACLMQNQQQLGVKKKRVG